jgi:hypothetical protein
LIFGTTYNRSYVKGMSRLGHKGFSFHAGYKLRWFENFDFIVYGGVVPHALLSNNPSSVSGNGYFIRTALELYY